MQVRPKRSFVGSRQPSRPTVVPRTVGSGFAAVAVAACVGIAAVAMPARAQSLETAANIDPARYAGLWYEVARLPNATQARCVADTTSTFTLRSAHYFDVGMRCQRADGTEESDLGIARIRNPATNAKMEIRFLPLALAWWPFAWSDYWVLDVAPDYAYAMAGSPARDTLWILSRRRDLDPAVYERLVAKARALGFDVGKLIRSSSATG